MIIPSTPITEATYYILLSLITPLHGYGIIQNVEQLSHGRVTLAAGTLYGAINTMVKKKLILPLPEIKSSRKKEYQITGNGYEILQKEISRLEELLLNGTTILGGIDNEHKNS